MTETAPEPGNDAPTVSEMRSQVRALREEREREWRVADAERMRRVEQIVDGLDDALGRRLNDRLREWVRTLASGITLRYTSTRYHEALEADRELTIRASGLIDEIQAGRGTTARLRETVAEARAALAEANRRMVAEVPAQAGKILRYVEEHLRARFVSPEDRAAYAAMVTGHLAHLAANPMRQIVEAEERVGQLELGCADELDAGRQEAAGPAP